MHKRHFVLLVFLSGFFLTACSTTKLAYNNFPLWAPYYIDDYVDLDRKQEKLLDIQLTRFIEWHRVNELPELQILLAMVQKDIEDSSLDYGRIQAYHNLSNRRFVNTVYGFIPTLAAVVPKLSDEQAKELKGIVDKKIEKALRKSREGTSEQQLTRRAEKLEDAAEYWVGNINDRQRKLLREMAGYQLEMRPVFNEFRAQILTRLYAMIDNRRSIDLDAELKLFARDFIYFNYPEKQWDIRLLLSRRFEVLNRLNTTLTDNQKAHLIDRLTDIQAEIQGLHGLSGIAHIHD
ncbi:DUF6279 family lipoprotein [Parasalinivibrio latis]|uniref:DUF6279 family lipoprotein n=1 Tax=Parasalinivibrio latis TaxID=2952610 RepID=UPI0030E206A8